MDRLLVPFVRMAQVQHYRAPTGPPPSCRQAGGQERFRAPPTCVDLAPLEVEVKLEVMAKVTLMLMSRMMSSSRCTHYGGRVRGGG